MLVRVVQYLSRTQEVLACLCCTVVGGYRRKVLAAKHIGTSYQGVPPNSNCQVPAYLTAQESLKMASPITCHVLNTLTGTPAAGIETTLTLLNTSTSSSTTMAFTATTDADGRVKLWDPAGGTPSLEHTMAVLDNGERSAWSLKFAIGPWYEGQGTECFWPEIEVKFYVKKGERHYHVPVLVGPWTYTTYRGS